MSGDFLTAEEIAQLANIFVVFEQENYPNQPAKSVAEFVQIIQSDMEMIVPFAQAAAPTLLEIQREQNMSALSDDESVTPPKFFNSDTYYRSVLSAIRREHDNAEQPLQRQNKIIDDLLDNLRFQQDPYGVIRALIATRRQLGVALHPTLSIIDPYAGEESKIERYLICKGITVDKLIELDNVPLEMLDPIMHEIMLKPVNDALGYTYDFNSMRTWLEQTPENAQPRTPMSNEVLDDINLVRNVEMEDKILELVSSKFGPVQKKLKC